MQRYGYFTTLTILKNKYFVKLRVSSFMFQISNFSFFLRIYLVV